MIRPSHASFLPGLAAASAMLLAACGAPPCPQNVPPSTPAAATGPAPTVPPSWGLKGDPRLSFDGLSVRTRGIDPFGAPARGGSDGGTTLFFRFVDPEHELIGLNESKSHVDRWLAVGGTRDLSAGATVTGFSRDRQRGVLEIAVRSPARPPPGTLGFDVAGSLAVQRVASLRKTEELLPRGDTSPHSVEGLQLSREDGPSSLLNDASSATSVRVEGANERVGDLQFFDASGAELHPRARSVTHTSSGGSSVQTQELVFEEVPAALRVVVPVRSLATESVPFEGTLGIGL